MSANKHGKDIDLQQYREKAEKARRAAEDPRAKAQAAEHVAELAMQKAEKASQDAEAKSRVLADCKAVLEKAEEAVKAAEQECQEKEKDKDKSDWKAAQKALAEATEAADRAKADVKLAAEESEKANEFAAQTRADALKQQRIADDAEQNARILEKAADEAYRDYEHAEMASQNPCLNHFDSTTLKPFDPEIDEMEISWFHKGKKMNGTAGVMPFAGLHVLVLPRDLPRPQQVTIEATTSTADCNNYVSSPVTFGVAEKGAGCCVPIPWTALEETCTLKFEAYDCSSTDFIEHAKFFLDHVRLKVSGIKTASSSQAGTPQSPAFSRMVTTHGGKASISVPRKSLYQIESFLDGYVSRTSAIQYHYICCDKELTLKVHLHRCANDQRRLLFIQDCGKPWGMSSVVVQGQLQTTEEDGSLVVEDIDEALTIEYPGKSFSQIESVGSVSIVTVKDVADTGVARLPRHFPQKDHFFELGFDGGSVPADVKVMAHTPDGHFLAEVLRDSATGLFRYPIGHDKEKVLFKVMKQGNVIDQALLTAGE